MRLHHRNREGSSTLATLASSTAHARWSMPPFSSCLEEEAHSRHYNDEIVTVTLPAVTLNVLCVSGAGSCAEHLPWLERVSQQTRRARCPGRSTC